MSASQEHVAQVKELAHHLVEIVTKQETHRVALEALISAFVSVAVSHPCCARQAAATARELADYIEIHAAPAGAPIH